jgi:hypothetical protein
MTPINGSSRLFQSLHVADVQIIKSEKVKKKGVMEKKDDEDTEGPRSRC